MKILIINPPIREWAKPNCVPLGLGYVAATLRIAGHSVDMLDINGYRYSKDQVLAILDRKNPDFIMTGGLITVYNYLKWLTLELHERFPGIPVMLGGSVSTSIPDLALDTLPIDSACIGEGEITAVEVANALQSGKDLLGIPGIYYRKDGKIIKNVPRAPIKDMDSIPFPAYDLFPMDIYVNNPVGYINKDKWGKGESVDEKIPKSTNINVTRGCPYKCKFCYHDYLGPGYRHRTPQNILDEMNLLHNNYGVNYFLWADDESIINKRFVYDFCDLMMKSGSDYEFAVSGRVNLVDEHLLTTLKSAGCTMVGYGIESGSQKMLDAMRKDVTVEQAKNAITLTKKIFGDADCSFLIGYPGETDKTIQETEEFCMDLDLAPEVIFFATAYPGTELYTNALKQNLIKDEVAYISSLWEQGEQIAINFTEWTNEELFEKRQSLIKRLKAGNITRHQKDEKL
jgi:anaerobic magnesium-protoporphyrin IX monomethyl ester cyclase